MDLPTHQGKVHDYLVKVTMSHYIDELIHETPADLMKGTSATPAANHLFSVNPECHIVSSLDSKAVISFKKNLAR
jgi:hypothetical protein